MSDNPSFTDLVDDLAYGAPLEIEEESQDNPEAPEEESPTPEPERDEGDESRSEPDTPEEDPGDELETPAEADEESAEPAEDDEPAEEDLDEDEDLDDEEAEEPEDDTDDDTSDDLPLPEGYALREGRIVTEIDGEWRDLDDLKRRGLRQSDYTRKTQDLAAQREQLQAQAEQQQNLANEIAASENMQAFLREHPEALPYLMQEPESTMELIRSPSALEEFWQDYEAISDNPRLQRRLAERREPEPDPETEAELTQARAARTIQQITRSLDSAVQYVAQDFPDVPQEEVGRWVAELGGLTEDQISSEQDVYQGYARLHQLFYTQDGRIDTKLIRDRFESLSELRQRQTQTEAEEREEHNRKVDEELQAEQERPPATPEGDAPVDPPERVETPDSFGEAIDGILYG